MRELSDATFEAEVLHAGRPVVVDFRAPWCRPCDAVEPVLEELAADHGERVVFARIDVDANPLAAARYGVLSLPTVMLFEDGEPRQTVVGARKRAQYEKAFGF